MKWVRILFVSLILAVIPLFVAQADEATITEGQISEVQAAEGKDVFQKRCANCHQLPKKTKRTAKQWDQLVDVMQGIMTQRGVAVLSEDEKQQVLVYLKESAVIPASENESEAEDLFVTRCAMCHQLPEPGMLKPQQWKLILMTMQQRMQQAGVPQLNEQENAMIIEYLTERAR